MKLSELPNDTLGKRIAAGDETAFSEFYHHWRGYVLYRVREAISGNREDTEEIAADVFANLWRLTTDGKHWTGAAGDCDYARFALGIIRIEIVYARSRLRKISEREAKIKAASYQVHYQSAKVDVGDEVVKGEFDAALDASLLKLTSRQRLAFLLRHREGYTLKRTSKILKVGCAHEHVATACRYLRRYLAHFEFC